MAILHFCRRFIPMSYQIIWYPKGAIKRFSGRVSGSDIYHSVVDMHRDPEFDSIRYVINDFLAAESLSFAGFDIHEVAAIDQAASASNPNILIAVVASKREIIDLAREYVESPLCFYPTEIFPDMATAERWLVKSLRERFNLEIALPARAMEAL